MRCEARRRSSAACAAGSSRPTATRPWPTTPSAIVEEAERLDVFDPFFATPSRADDLGLTLAAALARQGGALHLGTPPDRGPDFARLFSASASQDVG